MESNPDMPYDTSFAYGYQWSQPDQDLVKALQILRCPLEAHTSEPACPLEAEEYESIKILLASNPDTPWQVLEHLSRYCSHAHILERLAGNPRTSTNTLRHLARSAINEVRAAVAENINADAETVRALAADEHTDVRFRLAENHNTNIEILEILTQDDNPYVAHRAQMTVARITSMTSENLHQLPNQSPNSGRRQAM